MARRKSAGCLGMLLFFLIGSAFAGIGWFAMLAPELEVENRFVEGRCIILGKELVSEQKRARRRAGRSGRTRTVYRPEFDIRHEVAGKSYEARTFRIVPSSTSDRASQEAILGRFETGHAYPCWYDPADPSRVVLEKGVSKGSLVFIGVGLFFALFGAAGGAAMVLRRSRSV